MKTRLAAAFACVGLMAPGVLEAKPTDRYAETNTEWDRFGAVYARVVDSYYDSLSQTDLLQAAIHGVLGELDSYSQYYDQEGLRQLRQDTTGKFAGLGITVAVKDSYPIVIAPIEGTPAERAGLLPGDLIVSIEGQDTFGMSLDAVVGILRGEPGTTVRIGVAHKRGQPPRPVAIRREVINIRSVALVERIDGSIGYISMRQTRFSEETATEVQSGLEDLTALGVNSLILDLRGNPGGLLSQAQQVADLFLPKGVPIVSVREREGRREDTKYSLKTPIALDLPLVILIDEGSASAAEIVAGAVQDNDRGIIVGNTSFGKGSVQTIFDLYETSESALKLTTALYYTPSGRSIHRPGAAPTMRTLSARQIAGLNLPAQTVVSSLLSADNRSAAAAALRVALDVDQTQAERILAAPLGALIGPRAEGAADADSVAADKDRYFRTRRGRKVYGGGGITPDVIVERDSWPGFARHLERGRFFFDFVIDQVPADSISALRARGYTVDDEMVRAFRRFVDESEYASNGHLRADAELAELREIAAQMEWTAETLESIDRLESVIRQEEKTGFATGLEPYVRAALKRELSLRLSGRKAQLRAALESDRQLKAAIEILGDADRYRQILRGTS